VPDYHDPEELQKRRRREDFKARSLYFFSSPLL